MYGDEHSLVQIDGKIGTVEGSVGQIHRQFGTMNEARWRQSISVMPTIGNGRRHGPLQTRHLPRRGKESLLILVTWVCPMIPDFAWIPHQLHDHREIGL